MNNDIISITTEQLSLLIAVLTFALGLWQLRVQLREKARKEQHREPKPEPMRTFSNPGEPGWKARPKTPLGELQLDPLGRPIGSEWIEKL